ncbi:cupredoxin domain-containing protein [Geodermatophilus sp. URMC 60]
MPHATGPTRSARRAAPLVLALGIGLVSGCSADDGAADAAPSTSAEASSAPSSSAEASASSAAPSSPASSPAEAQSETVAVTEGEMFIELAEDSYSAGSYTFEVVNEGRMPHDFVVERNGEDVAATEVLQPGQSATLTVTLDEGDYVFYCSVGSHRAAGMETPIAVSA